MLHLMWLEWKLCFRRVEFQIVFGVLLFFAVGSFFESCILVRHTPLTFIRSAWEMGMIQGIQAHIWLGVELMLLPLLASIVYADSYYTDLQLGLDCSILTRASTQLVIWAKYVTNALVVFLVVFVPLLINQGLCLLAFPMVGLDNNNGLPPYDLGVQNYAPTFLFDLLRIQSPVIYNTLYMVIISGFASLFALCTFALYLVVQKGKFVILTTCFVLFIAIEFGFNMLGFGQESLYHILSPNVVASPVTLCIWHIGLFVISTVLVFLYSHRHEPGLVH